MKYVMTCTERRLDGRFRLLAQRLNEDLAFRDQRLRFVKIPARSGITAWVLRNDFLTEAQENAVPLAACELATSSEDAAAVHVAYTETWVSVGRKVGLRFKSSNLRFVVTTTDPNGLPLQFRLEWVGRDLDNSTGILVYPGRGAAHPHWQFDVDASWNGDGYQGEIAVDLESDTQKFEHVDLSLDTSGLPHFDGERSAYFWFHRLHLPARAMWHEGACLMPNEPETHQHEPREVDEIDQWVLSALRYIRHEFSLYT